MTDQYLTIATIAADQSMNARVTACAAQQGAPGAPETWSWESRYGWAAAPGWGAAWDSAAAAGIPEPGKDPAVITDGMILSQVQGMIGGG